MVFGFDNNKPSRLIDWNKQVESVVEGKSWIDFLLLDNLLTILDRKTLQSVISPHILNEDGNKSLSSFIPFCSFGKDMKAMGTEVKGFNIPVCNGFKAKVIHDQLCYEVDLKNYEKKGK